MASIRKETVIDIGIEPAWAALRRVGEPHTLFAPVLTGARIGGRRPHGAASPTA